MYNDLVKRLDTKARMIEVGEKIAWGSDTALMREAARKIEEMQRREDRIIEALKTALDDVVNYRAWLK